MQCQVVTMIRNKGIGKVSKNPFDFLVVGGLITTPRGTEFAEFMLDGDAPVPEIGKHYAMEVTAYPNKEKKLTFRVEALRLAPAPAPAKP